MTSDRKERRWSRIPIRFKDATSEGEEKQIESYQGGDSSSQSLDAKDSSGTTGEENIDLGATAQALEDALETVADDQESEAGTDQADRGRSVASDEAAGPVFAELIATRSELKRVQAEVEDLRDKLARRQADFENFRKRIERERSETYTHAVADLVAKLLPVLDNLRRALDTEASVEASESDEFRHFLSGVDLIYKQLGGVLDTLGVKLVPAVGERFDPHVHEAVTTEETDDYLPDTVMQEIVPGYRLGAKLLRPALVKVAVKK
jgi:molecular chaperone GrpE